MKFVWIFGQNIEMDGEGRDNGNGALDNQHGQNIPNEQDGLEAPGQITPDGMKLDIMYRQIKNMEQRLNEPGFMDLTNIGVNVRQSTLNDIIDRYTDLFYHIIAVQALPERERLQIQFEEVNTLRVDLNEKLQQRAHDLERLNPEAPVGDPQRDDHIKTVNVIMGGAIQNTWGYFDGDYMKWKGFRDRFNSAVHNKDMNAADKFAHLKSSLTGEAARAFGEWQLNETCYQDAYDRINQLYDRPYKVCTEHIHMLFRLPTLRNPATAEELQTMSNVTHEQIRQLKANDVPAEHWDMIICVILHDRLQNDTGRQWDLARTSEKPTAKDFLDKQAAALANVAPGRDQITVTIPNKQASGQNYGQNYGQNSGKSYGQAVGGAMPRRYPCKLCGKDHPLFLCDQFLALNVVGRRDAVLRLNVCTNCLKSGHEPAACYQKGCPDNRCKASPMHNSTLCTYKQRGLAAGNAMMVNTHPGHYGYTSPSSSSS